MDKSNGSKIYARILRRFIAAAIVFPPLMASTSVRQDFDFLSVARQWISATNPSTSVSPLKSDEAGAHWSEKKCSLPAF